MKLREGITWHDGMPFTSADVQATFDRILDPNIKKAPNAEASVPIIESVSSPDAETVIFDMGDQPSNLILPYLATTWISIVPKHIFDQKGPDGLLEAPVGTGPFLIDWADKQRGIGYKKNPDYWATDQEGRALPYLDQMELNTVKDSTQQLALIRGGQVDVWPMWPAMEISTANAIKSQLGDQIYIDQLQLDAIVQMFLNTSAPPFDNPQVRLAAMHALGQARVGEPDLRHAVRGRGLPRLRPGPGAVPGLRPEPGGDAPVPRPEPRQSLGGPGTGQAAARGRRLSGRRGPSQRRHDRAGGQLRPDGAGGCEPAAGSRIQHRSPGHGVGRILCRAR